MMKSKKSFGDRSEVSSKSSEEKIFFDIHLELEKLRAEEELWIHEELHLQPRDIQLQILRNLHNKYMSRFR
jgi:hypothetical protein